MKRIITYCNELTLRCFAQAVELVMLRHRVAELEAQNAKFHAAFGDVRVVTREHWAC